MGRVLRKVFSCSRKSVAFYEEVAGGRLAILAEAGGGFQEMPPRRYVTSTGRERTIYLFQR